jgi:hypothetical protein
MLSPLSTQNRRELVQQLIAAKSFGPAFELWRPDKSLSPPVILNGGFEGPIDVSGVDGFGWYIFGKPEPKVVRDESAKLSGAASLLLGFNGDWKAPADTISQRIVVEPEKRYRISFGVRTKALVTGGPPIIVVMDASNNQRLGQSEAVPTPASDWQAMSFEFSTTPATEAIVLTFARAEGECKPCPIFGELWLDDFVIADVSTTNPQR